jgi:hypothetical protein
VQKLSAPPLAFYGQRVSGSAPLERIVLHS